MSDAVQFLVLDAVDEVDQQLLAHAAHEARGMEEVASGRVACELVCPHAHVLLINLRGALSAQDRLAGESRQKKGTGGEGERRNR